MIKKMNKNVYIWKLIKLCDRSFKKKTSCYYLKEIASALRKLKLRALVESVYGRD